MKNAFPPIRLFSGGGDFVDQVLAEL